MIDKNLYYIIRKGTNSRALSTTQEPLIATAKAADEWILKADRSAAIEYEKITISKYEERYGTEKPESAADIPETIVPMLIVRGASIDDISVKQVGIVTIVNRISIDRSRNEHVAIISGIHEDLWPQRNYPAHLINYTNHVKGGRIYFTVKVKDENEQEEL